ncbi:integrase/recombinase XerC [Tenacibaculum sp. MAR_2009_124]|uniref:tyrosine-type recombinase/integrase n=1 Tax=Tenacibaculum sp. MAR_2009_124 TaxID=1250059 RepID=UPI000895F2BB|nr:tyrosine-type recombinase/integrase [Tenacibaculum sp. MAR_2009_124]SEB73744.1 integrase/recombinase XerC [Tenacibaculum sp. MAR_2009_124]
MSVNLVNKFLEYLEYEKKYSKHTVLAYRKDLYDFANYCRKEFGQEDIKEIHYNQIRSWIVLLVDEGLVNRSVNRKISSLKTCYNFLQKIGEIKVSPLAKHQSLKIQKKISVPFTEKEVGEVIDLLKVKDDFEGVRDRLIVELLYSTGIRRAELINIKVSDINFEERLLKVLGKRNKERFVVLLPFVIDTIRSYQGEKNKLNKVEDNDYLLLTKKGVKIYETLVYRIINSYFRGVSTKVKKSPHILRHAFATHLLNKGASLYSVKELLGHSSLASTQVYTHSSLEKLKQVYNKTHPRELN